MNKRVHQIAKEQGLTAKELIARLREAGHEVKAASSNVDEELALKVLSNGEAKTDAPPPAAPPSPPQAKSAAPSEPAPESPVRAEHKQRPTRDSLQGERAPG